MVKKARGSYFWVLKCNNNFFLKSLWHMVYPQILCRGICISLCHSYKNNK
jgi:hypothetical protein